MASTSLLIRQPSRKGSSVDQATIWFWRRRSLFQPWIELRSIKPNCLNICALPSWISCLTYVTSLMHSNVNVLVFDYYIHLVVIIYKLLNITCEFTTEMYCQYLLFIIACFGWHTRLVFCFAVIWIGPFLRSNMLNRKSSSFFHHFHYASL